MDIEPRELRPLCDVVKVMQHFAVVDKIVFQIVIAYVFQSPFLFLFFVQCLFQRLFALLNLRLCLNVSLHTPDGRLPSRDLCYWIDDWFLRRGTTAATAATHGIIVVRRLHFRRQVALVVLSTVRNIRLRC